MAATGARRLYSGAWRQQSQYRDIPADLAPGVDPSHRYPDERDGDSRPPSGAPLTDKPPLYMTVDSDDAWIWEVDTPGIVQDVEPRDHNSEDLSVAVPSPAHAVNRGRVAQDTLAPRYIRFSDERYETDRHETKPVTGDLTVATLRADNSLPENNPPVESYPDGYRFGFSRVARWIDRRAFPSAWRRHDEHALRHMTAAASVQSPSADQPNRYTSPFSWNLRAIRHAGQIPVLRREPSAWDEDVLVSSAEIEDQDAYMDFVIG